jgi:capsular exopolysaccharide synthesis family protein
MESVSVPASPSKIPGTARELRHYLNVLRKRWRVVTGVLVVSLAVALVYTVRQPKLYEATCSLVIESSAPQVLEGVKDVIEMAASTREFYITQYRIIRSEDNAQRVIDRLGLASDSSYAESEDHSKRLDRQALIERLLKAVKVVGVRESRIANILVTDVSPERATRIANAFADTYIERNLDFKLEGARSAGTWLGEQTVDLRKQLESSEMELYRFRKERNLLDVGLDDKLGMTRQNLQSLNSKITDVKARRIEIESIRKLILAAKNDISERESLPEIRDNPVVQKLRENYLDLLKIKADLESRYGEKHPKIDTIQHQMAAVQRDYGKELDDVLRAFNKRYEALVETEKSLSQWMNHEKQQALELAKLETEYRPLARDAENNGKVYSLINQRQKEINLTGMLRANNVRILDRATPPRRAVSPILTFNLTVGLVLGLIFGLLLAFVVESLDNTIKTPEAAEELVGAPLLGVIPMLSQARQHLIADAPERDLAVFKDPTSLAAEACRSIRTNMMFISAQKEFSLFSVTSPGPQDGKTTVAINLAVTMAQAGGRVLLIDTDMRRPRIHKSFGMKPDKGISSVMAGDVQLKDAIVKSEVPNLDVLPCGPMPPNPAELLHTERFREILAQCRKDYDRVVLDSPPIAPVTDPAIIGSATDGVVLVFRAGHTTREAAQFARRQLADAGARILGLVINQTDRKGVGYGYGYGYSPYGRYGRYYRAA